jgi:predicted nucleotidyltransferase component of viral defense system
LVQSAKARLVQRAHDDGRDPNLVLSRFALERFLYRLSRSSYRDHFVLKGGMMLLVWLGETARPTRDVDLLGLRDLDPERLTEIVREISTEGVEPDGMTFDPGTVTVQSIRRDDPDGGHRVALFGNLCNARIKLQIDVGFGDAVVPSPEWIDYPSLLGQPTPRLRAYQPETTIAEKFHAMVSLGVISSRLRDYYDVRLLAAKMEFDGQTLIAAVRATFDQRGLEVPTTARRSVNKSSRLLPTAQLPPSPSTPRSAPCAASPSPPFPASLSRRHPGCSDGPCTRRGPVVDPSVAQKVDEISRKHLIGQAIGSLLSMLPDSTMGEIWRQTS